MPRIIDGLVAAEAAAMLAHQLAVLTQLDPLGIGADLDRAPDCVRRDRVALLSNRPTYGTKAVRSASKTDHIV